MMYIRAMKWIAPVAAALLLTCSTIVRAENCAGGEDDTGNECNSEQSVPDLSNAAPGLSYAAPSLSKADTRILSAKQAETLAQTRVAQAKQRESEARADRKIAEANLIAARKAVIDAQYVSRR